MRTVGSDVNSYIFASESRLVSSGKTARFEVTIETKHVGSCLIFTLLFCNQTYRQFFIFIVAIYLKW